MANGSSGMGDLQAHESLSNKIVTDSSPPNFGTEGPPQDDGSSRESVAPTREEVTPEAGLESAEMLEVAEVEGEMLLDAYWGSYDNPGLEQVFTDPDKSDTMLEKVIGIDQREEVLETNEYPWRAIASLRITAANGKTYIGTGWFIGPRILVTAGHCVYMHQAGGWVRQIEVIPGRRNGGSMDIRRPYGSCVTTDYRSVRGWVANQDTNFDYGAILLPEDCRLGERVGWFGYAIRDDDDLEDLLVNISGYPVDKRPSGVGQYHHSNELADYDERQLQYIIDTFGGQSGAPVWYTDEAGNRYGVGIHTSGHINSNFATRINREVFDNLRAWKALAP